MVEQGYKLTEVGVIPEDWNSVQIKDIACVKGGSTPKTSISKYWDGHINWFTPTEVGEHKYLYFSNRKITEVGLKDCSATILPIGTILMTTRAGIGDLGILKNEASTNQGFQSLICNNNINNEYLYYLMQTKKNDLLRNASGSTFLEISPSKVKSILIPLPPLPEQNSIAEALSDMDALIAQTEQLIEKKKAIKQGMMHELLTPKEGWVTKKLGEIAELKNGYAFKSAYYNQAGEFLIITIANVQDGHMEIADCNRISHIPDTVQSFQKLNIGDILISMTGNVGRICKVNTYKTLLNQRVGKITPTNIDGDFLFYLLRDKRFINKMILSAQGGAQGNIGKSDILDYEASLPPTPKEQARIAQILLDMDSEIEQLEKQLSKAQSIKQGMMQQLLTGKTRLI